MGKNYTLYIQTDNDGQFSQLPQGEKGPLVNMLLSGYYSGNLSMGEGAKTVTTSFAGASDMTKVAHLSSVNAGTTNFKLDKNGHILQPNGLCLVKGCKYGKPQKSAR